MSEWVKYYLEAYSCQIFYPFEFFQFRSYRYRVIEVTDLVIELASPKSPTSKKVIKLSLSKSGSSYKCPPLVATELADRLAKLALDWLAKLSLEALAGETNSLPLSPGLLSTTDFFQYLLQTSNTTLPTYLNYTSSVYRLLLRDAGEAGRSVLRVVTVASPADKPEGVAVQLEVLNVTVLNVTQCPAIKRFTCHNSSKYHLQRTKRHGLSQETTSPTSALIEN